SRKRRARVGGRFAPPPLRRSVRCWRWRATCAMNGLRGEAGRGATHLGARIAMDDYQPTRTTGPIRPRSRLRVVVGAVLAAFLLGAAGAWYLAGDGLSLRGLFSVQADNPAPD